MLACTPYTMHTRRLCEVCRERGAGMKRHFTRQQVEARCLQIHPNDTDQETTHIKNVTLLIGVPFALWHVAYEKVYGEGASYEMRTTLTDIYQEVKIGDRLVLLPISEKPIPAGCASVEEEDKAMKSEVEHA